MKAKMLKYYSLFTCVFTGGFALLYFSLICFALYNIIFPPVSTLDKFSYNDLNTNRFWIGIHAQDAQIFSGINKEEFDSRKEYFFNAALESHKKEIPRKLVMAIIYITLHIVVFLTHFGLLRRLKRFGV